MGGHPQSGGVNKTQLAKSCIFLSIVASYGRTSVGNGSDSSLRGVGGSTMAWFDPLTPFVAELGNGEDRIPLERVMRRHLAAFCKVRDTGRTWQQIAKALTNAGARRMRGQPICPKQLATVFRRINQANQFGTSMSRELPLHRAEIGQEQLSARVSIQRRPAAPPPLDSAATTLSRMADTRRIRNAARREFDE
jgi:hypothetical protein